MPRSFPLLKLPSLCFEAIFQNINAVDLVHFSLVSKRCYWLLKSIKSPVKELYFNQKCGSLFFGPACEEWRINFCNYQEQADIVVNINGSEVKTFWNHTRAYSYSNQSVFEFYKCAVPYLLDIFKCQVNECLFNIDDIPDLTEILDYGFTSCRDFHLEGNRLVRDEEMLSIIEKLTVKKYSLFLNLSKTFNCNPRIFKTDFLGLGSNSAKWLSKETLQHIPHIRMYRKPRISLTAEDFIAFVGQWYHSENRTFKSLIFRVGWELPNNLLTQFNPRDYVSKERSPVFPFYKTRRVNCVGGKDILRSDGLLATVYRESSTIYFYVWHERFPEEII